MTTLKFKVTQKNVTPQGVNLQLNIVPEAPENADFFAVTPQGSISLGMVEPSEAAAFAVGAEFLAELTEA